MCIRDSSYILPRENLKTTKAIPESQWQTSDTPVLTKLRQYACYNYEIDTLFRNTIKQSKAKKSFDINYFRAGLTKLNMSNDVIILPQGQASDLILNTWRQFWPVSYTHLDVYKRQIIGNVAAKPSEG